MSEPYMSDLSKRRISPATPSGQALRGCTFDSALSVCRPARGLPRSPRCQPLAAAFARSTLERRETSSIHQDPVQ